MNLHKDVEEKRYSTELKRDDNEIEKQAQEGSVQAPTRPARSRLLDEHSLSTNLGRDWGCFVAPILRQFQKLSVRLGDQKGEVALWMPTRPSPSPTVLSC